MKGSPESNKTFITNQIVRDELGLHQYPHWSRDLETAVISARKVIEQSEAVGGSDDPRLPAARRVLDYAERIKEKEAEARKKGSS